MMSISLPNHFLKMMFKALIIIQLIILGGTYFCARTPYLWFWSIAAFVPALFVCLYASDRKSVVLSLVLLFVSQQGVFIFANPNWGFGFGSDAVNDFHTASVLSERSHFELGQLGYASRLSYSYYPMIHLFSVILNSVSGLPLMSVAMYFVPVLNALVTTFSLYCLNHELFGLEGRTRNLATLIFETSFVYTSFDSQFVRETFAFPLVLLALLIATRIAKGQSRVYSIVMTLLVGAAILSHQISSYLLVVILGIIALSFSVFHHNGRLNKMLFLAATMLGCYTSFVVLSFSTTEWTYAFEGIQAIFLREGSHTILRSQSASMVYLSLTYYALLAVFSAVGGIRLLRSKKKDWVALTVTGFFTLAFIVCVLLRLSTSADPWGWTYYMALRGTIWAFLGISVIATIGITCLFRLDNAKWKGVLSLLLVVCILGVGKFSQFPPLVTDSSSVPVTYPRYAAALWLKGETTHGMTMLVAPYELDNDAFEASRDMAPYAYLKEYFIEQSKGHLYDRFYGYIPFVGKFFDEYRNSTNVQIFYSNGEVDIGYKPRPETWIG